MIEPFFEYDGIRSDTVGVGLQIVRLEGGMFPIPYVSGKSIIEDSNSRSLSPYFYRIKYEPLEFSLTLTTLDGNNMDSDMLYQIGAWLFTNTYRPFISSENPSRMLYCMATNKVDFMTTGMESGYITVQFRCRDPHWFTLPQITNFDLSGNTTTTTIQMINYSNVNEYYYPEVEIELLDNTTTVSLSNAQDGNRLFGFTNLSLLETIYIDNKKRTIVSSTTNYRFDKLTGKVWLRLTRGINNLTVVGKCNLQFRCQFPVYN